LSELPPVFRTDFRAKFLPGFAEAAAAAHAIHGRVHPGTALHFEYSSREGVAGLAA
jgi:thioredoxin reductase (NADPH)